MGGRAAGWLVGSLLVRQRGVRLVHRVVVFMVCCDLIMSFPLG